MRVYQNELTAMDGDFSPFEQGNQYQNPQHPYSLDLDVFGRDSLFNRICRTITTAGSDVLAENLSRENPLSKEELAKRTALQKELAEQGEDWRMEFFALGVKNKTKCWMDLPEPQVTPNSITSMWIWQLSLHVE